ASSAPPSGKNAMRKPVDGPPLGDVKRAYEADGKRGTVTGLPSLKCAEPRISNPARFLRCAHFRLSPTPENQLTPQWSEACKPADRSRRGRFQGSDGAHRALEIGDADSTIPVK